MKNNLFYVLTGCFFLTFLVLLPFSALPTDASTSPSINSLIFSETSGGTSISAVNLQEGSAKRVYVQAEVSDADSCEDITIGGSAYVHMYLSSETNSCADNPTNCYHSYACSFSNCIDNLDTELSVSCTVDLEPSSVNTNTGPSTGASWIGELVVEDSTLESDLYGFGFEMNGLLAYTLDSFLDYGTLDFNQISTPQTIYIQNTGNTGLDIEIYGPDPMTCNAGEIAADLIKVSDASGFDYAMGQSIDTSHEMEINLEPSSDGLPTETPIYFRLKMPENGASGTCSNTIQATGVADSESGY